MALEHQPWVELGPVGTNKQVSDFHLFGQGLCSHILKNPPPCLNCEQQKEQCDWVDSSQVCVACTQQKIACSQKDMPQRPKWKSPLFIKSDVEGVMINTCTFYLIHVKIKELKIH